MINKTSAILLFLFIFGMAIQGYAASIKSKENTVNQEITMKIDANKVALQKKAGTVKSPIKTSEKHASEFQPNLLYKDRWWVSDDAKLNFLKILEEKRKTRLEDYLEKIDYSDGFFQNVPGEKILRAGSFTTAKSSNSDVAPSPWELYLPKNKYLDERRILETFKFLQFKREELYKEIFMGFHLSFKPLSAHLFLEMNATPSFGKGQTLIIPF